MHKNGVESKIVIEIITKVIIKQCVEDPRKLRVPRTTCYTPQLQPSHLHQASSACFTPKRIFLKYTPLAVPLVTIIGFPNHNSVCVSYFLVL